MINPKYKNVFMSPGGEQGITIDGPHHEFHPSNDSDQPTKVKKSLITAVKKLLGKLGAEEVEGNNLVEVIDSGANALANINNNSNLFVVTFTEENKVFSADKTSSQIYDAFLSGKTIVGFEEVTKQYYNFCGIEGINPAFSTMIFYAARYTNNSIQFGGFIYDDTLGTWTTF